MAGVPGKGGPVPKRSDQRRRRNKPTVEVTKAASGRAPTGESPAPDPEWHPIASEWFTSLADSGQSQFYEPSDWATARYIAEAMSQSLESSRMSGQLFSAILSGATELLTTEGARRRMRIELEKQQAGEDPERTAKVARMDAYRKAAADTSS